MSYGFNNDELSKLFADAGAAVTKAQQKTHAPATPPPQPKTVANHHDYATSQPHPAKQESHTTQSRIPVEEVSSHQIDSGLLDGDTLNIRLKDGSEAEILFSKVRGLAAGRIGSSQIIGWKYGSKVYYAIYKEINLKGMIPKMGFQVHENWKSFINMMSERTPSSADEGIKIAKKPMGILPEYATKDLFFDHIKGL